jgi:hypothetical protein
MVLKGFLASYVQALSVKPGDVAHLNTREAEMITAASTAHTLTTGTGIDSGCTDAHDTQRVRPVSGQKVKPQRKR